MIVAVSGYKQQGSLVMDTAEVVGVLFHFDKKRASVLVVLLSSIASGPASGVGLRTKALF